MDRASTAKSAQSRRLTGKAWVEGGQGGLSLSSSLNSVFATLRGSYYPLSVLRPSEQVPRYPDQNSLNHHSFAVSFDPTLFDDDNGPIDYYTVIVAEGQSNLTDSYQLQLNI